MEKYRIKSATACYTGGGIYSYYGKLESGYFWKTFDEWESVIICTQDTSTEESDFLEWQERYTVEELTGDDFKAFWNAMIAHILKGGKAYGIWSNYQATDLERRIIK